MAQKLLLSLATAGLALSANAQQTQYQEVMKSLRTPSRSYALERMKAHMPAAKTTGIRQRLVAQSQYSDTGTMVLVLTDSMRYKYSGTRGSEFDFTELQFTDFGTERNVLFDTSRYYTINNGSFMPVFQEFAGYTGGNRFADITAHEYDDQQSSFVPGSRTLFSYDAQGRMSRQLELMWNDASNQWDSSARTFYVYNAQGHLILDSTQNFSLNNWSPAMRNTRSLNAQGAELMRTTEMWNGSGWEPTERFTNTYTATNQLKTTLYETYSGIWENVALDSFSYTGSVPFYTGYSGKQWDGIGFVEFVTERRVLNAANLPDSANFTIDFGGMLLELHSKWTFNSFQNPTKTSMYMGMGGGPAPDPMAEVYYYYEQYDDGLSVAEKSPALDARIFPNPSNGTLNLQLSQPLDQNASLQLTDLSGRLLMRQAMAAGSKQLSLDLEHLPAGTYILRLNAANGQSLLSQKVVKQ